MGSKAPTPLCAAVQTKLAEIIQVLTARTNADQLVWVGQPGSDNYSATFGPHHRSLHLSRGTLSVETSAGLEHVSDNSGPLGELIEAVTTQGLRLRSKALDAALSEL
jgi:hypothetical protein